MIKFCNLYSGSSGNSIYLSCNNTNLLIDAGLSGKATTNALEQIGIDPKSIDAILISHDHNDHIKGAGILSRRLKVPIYANEGTWSIMESKIGEVKENNIKVFDSLKGFDIGDIHIEPFLISHDAKEPVAFNFFVGNKKITTLTDIGVMTNSILDRLQKSDLLFLESNHDENMLKVGNYPYFLKQRILGKKGHLSNEMASKVICYLAKQGMDNFIIGHLSRENNYPALAYETTNQKLKEDKILTGKDVRLAVAKRNQVGEMICL